MKEGIKGNGRMENKTIKEIRQNKRKKCRGKERKIRKVKVGEKK